MAEQEAQTEWTENDYTNCWDVVSPHKIVVADGLTAADIGIPQAMHVEGDTRAQHILHSLVAFDRASIIAREHPDLWFMITNDMRASAISILVEATKAYAPKFTQRYPLDYATRLPYFHKHSRHYFFEPDKRHVFEPELDNALRGLHQFALHRWKVRLPYTPGDVYSIDTFLLQYANLLEERVRSQGDENALKEFYRPLSGGRMANYRHHFVPRAVVAHDDWHCTHFKNGVNSARLYFSDFVRATGAGENDLPAFYKLTIATACNIIGQDNADGDEYSGIEIPDPPNLTNSWFVRIPFQYKYFEEWSVPGYLVYSAQLIYFPPSVIGRINPSTDGLEDCIVTTLDSRGNLVYLQPNTTGVATVNPRPTPIHLPASCYRDQLTTSWAVGMTPFDERFREELALQSVLEANERDM